MLVFEFVPNGTLFQHLHSKYSIIYTDSNTNWLPNKKHWQYPIECYIFSVKELEHLDWNARVRIIMGIAYCLQYMHGLNPPMPHSNLKSHTIFLTEDYAAKVCFYLIFIIFACIKVHRFPDLHLDVLCS